MRRVAIAGLLFAMTGGAAIATACGSFGDAQPASADAAASEAGGPDASAEAAPDATVNVDAAAWVLAAVPTLVAPTTSAATKLGSNGESLFWIEGGTRIVRASVTDCTTTELATGNISALGVDSQWIVWGDSTYKALGRNEVGMPPRTHPTPVSPGMILAGGTAYWLDPASVSACDSPCVTTSTAALIATPKLLAANATRLFVFGVDANGGAAGALFWLSLSGGDLNGPLATHQDPLSLAANEQQVFWVSSNGAVTGVPSGGGPSIAFDPVSGVQALAVDGAFVYVATATSIQRAPVAGGAWKPFVSGETAIKSLLLTSDSVVWGTSTAVRRALESS